MKRQLDICLDLETLSTKPNAAIIQIAAKPFCVTGTDGQEEFIQSRSEEFDAQISFEDIVLSYPHLDIEEATRIWWKKHKSASELIMKSLHIAYTLDGTLTSLNEYLLQQKERYCASEIIIWCQGKDFDIPILLNAMRECNMEPVFNPKKARCSRDFLFNSAELIAGKRGVDPYSMIDRYAGEGEQHDALYDVNQTIHNIIQMKLRLSETLKQRYNGNEDSNQQ